MALVYLTGLWVSKKIIASSCVYVSVFLRQKWFSMHEKKESWDTKKKRQKNIKRNTSVSLTKYVIWTIMMCSIEKTCRDSKKLVWEAKVYDQKVLSPA